MCCIVFDQSVYHNTLEAKQGLRHIVNQLLYYVHPIAYVVQILLVELRLLLVLECILIKYHRENCLKNNITILITSTDAIAICG